MAELQINHVNGVNGTANGTNGHSATVTPLPQVMKEVEAKVEVERAAGQVSHNVKDLRWRFDQVSAKMNQAIYNEQLEKVHETCLETVSVLVEILARTR